jgi:hypothetical protein
MAPPYVISLIAPTALRLADKTPNTSGIARSTPAEAVGFFGRKSPQHAYLRRGSKAVCPMSQICSMLKTPGNYVEVGFSGEICHPFLAHFRFSLPEGSYIA